MQGAAWGEGCDEGRSGWSLEWCAAPAAAQSTASSYPSSPEPPLTALRAPGEEISPAKPATSLRDEHGCQRRAASQQAGTVPTVRGARGVATTWTILLSPAAPNRLAAAWARPDPPLHCHLRQLSCPLPHESHRDSVPSCAAVSLDGTCAKFKRGGKAGAGVKCQPGGRWWCWWGGGAEKRRKGMSERKGEEEKERSETR